ncbi:4-hydroxybenzoate octaprenyltransferase [Streptomyces sp. NPDC005122]
MTAIQSASSDHGGRITRSGFLPPPSGTIAAALVSRSPSTLQPYLRLMRIQAPIGTWLYLLPGWWGICSAAKGAPDIKALFAFGIAALIMRGSICTVNDIVDRNIDAQVSRTISRPIPSGAVSVTTATVFTAVQAIVSLAILWWIRPEAAIIVLISYPTFIAYPFMKRITYLPQAWLGLCYNTLVFAGWVAITGQINSAALVIWGAGVFWTLGYDTIYGHQDREEDRQIGVKSSSLLFGRSTLPWVAFFYAATIAGLCVAGFMTHMRWPFYALMAAVVAHLTWQLATLDIDNPERCRLLFVSNRVAGGLVLLAVILGHWG